MALAAAAIKVSLFVEALLFGLTASRSMTHAVRVAKMRRLPPRRCAGEAQAPLLLLQSSAATELGDEQASALQRRRRAFSHN
jgi:hypothetical protein